MARSLRPSVSHLRAMDVDRCGHSALTPHDPLLDLGLELGLQQEEVLGLADLQVRGTADRRARVDQVGRVEDARAVLALVAAGLVVPAVRAGALDVPVRKETPVDRRVHLPDRTLLDEAVLVQPAREVLGDLDVLLRGAAPEVVEGEVETVVHGLLRVVRLRAEIGDGSGFLRGQLGRRAVLVGGADVEDVVTALAEIPGVHVRRKHRPDHVAQVLDPVDVGKRAGYQVSSHPWMLHFVRTAPMALPRRAQVGRPQPTRSVRSHVDITRGDGTGLQAAVIVSNRGWGGPVGFPAAPRRASPHSAARDRRPSESRTAEAAPSQGHHPSRIPRRDTALRRPGRESRRRREGYLFPRRMRCRLPRA